MQQVSIRKSRESLDFALSQIFRDLNLCLAKKRKIIIKPNICNYLHSSTAATTELTVIDALVKIINTETKECSIYIVESDSQGKLADVAFNLLGFRLLEKKYGNVKLVNLTSDEKIKKIHDGFYFREFERPKVFEDCDYFITVPKLKTFDGIYDLMTCSLKNQFGCNPFPRKIVYHDHLSEVIYDLNILFKPDLVIVDSILAMEGFGPSSGVPKRMDLLIGGLMPASVDVICAKIIGLNFNKIKHLSFALKNGNLGTSDVEIIGENMEKCQAKFILPNKNLIERFLRL